MLFYLDLSIIYTLHRYIWHTTAAAWSRITFRLISQLKCLPPPPPPPSSAAVPLACIQMGKQTERTRRCYIWLVVVDGSNNTCALNNQSLTYNMDDNGDGGCQQWTRRWRERGPILILYKTTTTNFSAYRYTDISQNKMWALWISRFSVYYNNKSEYSGGQDAMAYVFHREMLSDSSWRVK